MDLETQKRTIADAVKELRGKLALTQQGLAAALNCGIATIVRYEGGRGRPDVRQLEKMTQLAARAGQDSLAEEFQMFLNVGMGVSVPVVDPAEQLCIALARRLYQNPKRRAAFLVFAAKEHAALVRENEIRKERSDELFAAFDAHAKRLREQGQTFLAGGTDEQE
jgi:transcriptional regulator with XRE-family HTH domain